jgi:hypothetical protein
MIQLLVHAYSFIVKNQCSTSRLPDFLKALFQPQKHRFKAENSLVFDPIP